MKLLGLTGSIGMGKSTTAAMLRRMGYPVFDADLAVHRFLAAGGAAVAKVLAAFPDVGNASGGIDRAALGAQVFGDTPKLRRLEGILHPMVQRARREFLKSGARRRVKFTILDIPLLFETGGQKDVDAVLLASTSPMLQRQRVLARPGMTETKFRQILARQVPDRVKRRGTRHIIETGLGKAHAWNLLRRHLRMLENDPRPGLWGRHARNRVRYGNHRP